jgi:hypothetical protein
MQARFLSQFRFCVAEFARIRSWKREATSEFSRIRLRKNLSPPNPIADRRV